MLKNIPIRITVVTLFFLLTSIVAAVIIGLQFYFGGQLAKEATKQHFLHLTEKIENTVASIDETNSNLINLVEMDEKTDECVHMHKQHKILPLFASILKNNTKLYAIYIGYENGDFYELINLDIDKKLRSRYDAKSTDRWLVVKIADHNGTKEKHLELLDTGLHTTASKDEKTDYDPRHRPWFKKASLAGKVIKTEPYDFSNIKAKGVTYAKKVTRTGSVVAVDVLLNSLSDTLATHKLTSSMHSYLFDARGTIIAASGQDTKLFDQFYKDIKFPIKSEVSEEIKLGRETYILEVMPITSKYGEEYLGVTAPLYEVMKPYQDKLNLTLIFGVIALVLTFPMVWYTASIIVGPISKLRRESDKVRKREFDNVKLIRSNVLEVSELSRSLFSMSKAIHDYQQTLEEKIQERTHTISQLLADMKDSVEYALLIQKSLVADKEDIKKAFPQSFVIWEPKDVVAGDIYFFEELREGEYLLMCIDCTGHGVPGAFLTVATKSIQKELMYELKTLKNAMTPSQILAFFDREFKKLIKVEDDQTWHAGFDGGVLHIDQNHNKLVYAGAQTPLFFSRDGKYEMLKGDKSSVGYSGSRSEPHFEDYTLDTEKDMCLFLTTDGLLDQTGGPKGFSYGKKRFIKFLEKISYAGMEEQGRLMLDEYHDYMKNSHRKDDLTVIGLKLT